MVSLVWDRCPKSLCSMFFGSSLPKNQWKHQNSPNSFYGLTSCLQIWHWENSFPYYELNKFCLWASIASSLFSTPNAHPFSRESPPLLEFSNIVPEKARIFLNYKHFIHFQNRIRYQNLFRNCPLLLHSVCFSFM